jgi:hypothetical protein
MGGTSGRAPRPALTHDLRSGIEGAPFEVDYGADHVGRGSLGPATDIQKQNPKTFPERQLEL